MRRELSLYFTALSAGEALVLLSGALKTLLAGNRGVGPWASRLEEAWRQRFGGQDAVVFPSARSGLYAVLRALGVRPGDEVIVTGFTCTAVPIAVLQGGAIPLYADIDPSTYNMDAGGVECLVSPKTRVLLIQHTFGIPAAVVELVALARRHGLFVVEDACLALGSRLGERPLGSFGDASLFSFELSKTLSAGWGGLVQVNRTGLGEPLRAIRQEAGALPRWEAARRLWQVGLSYFLHHPTGFWAAKYLLAALFRMRLFRYSSSPQEASGRFPPGFLVAAADTQWRVIGRQLERLDAILESSHQATARYTAVLNAHGGNAPLPWEEQSSLRLIRFPLLVKDKKRILEYFARQGIELGRWFDWPISPKPADLAAFRYQPGQCPVAERVARHIVNVPLHARLSRDDVERVCEVLDSYLTRHPDEREFAREFLAVRAEP